MKINKIYKGDCSDIMAKMPDKSIDLTVTSPPYDKLRKYKGYKFDFESIAKQLFRIMKKGGVVVWVVGDATIKGSETGTSFRQALYFKEIGFNLRTMLFEKSNAFPTDTKYMYMKVFEYMFICTKGRNKIFNPLKEDCKATGRKYAKTWGRKNDYMVSSKKMGIVQKTKIKGNIWRYSISKGGTTNDNFAFKHPAIFPEQLVYDHILSWSNPGDLVLDPMCGSGTTCKMAKLNKRNYIGIEISEEYCKLARRRVKEVR